MVPRPGTEQNIIPAHRLANLQGKIAPAPGLKGLARAIKSGTFPVETGGGKCCFDVAEKPVERRPVSSFGTRDKCRFGVGGTNQPPSVTRSHPHPVDAVHVRCVMSGQHMRADFSIVSNFTVSGQSIRSSGVACCSGRESMNSVMDWPPLTICVMTRAAA